MGADQSSEEDYFEGPVFDSASENGLAKKKGMNIIVEDMQPLGDGCFRATGTNGFVYLLAERSSSLFTFVAYLASQRARQGYEHLIMEKRHLASLSKLEQIIISPSASSQPLILHLPQTEEAEEEEEPTSSSDRKKKQQTKDKQKEKDDFSAEKDLEGQNQHHHHDDGGENEQIQILSAPNALTFMPPPMTPPENIPLLPSPFITGTPHLEGYDELVAFRKINIPGDFFWIRPEELEVFRLLTMSRIGETFFMRMCKEYMLECETSPKTRKMTLEAYVRENELCPYANFRTKGSSSSKNKRVNHLHMHGNGLEDDASSPEKEDAIKYKTQPEDAVRQVLRGYEAFEGSIKASIFTDTLLMLFVSIQKLLQNTIESHGAVETQIPNFNISYSVLKEIKLLMDEVKQKLQDSYLHKNCPFKPEDVSSPPPTINNNNNMVMLDMGTPHHGSSSQNNPPPPPPSVNTLYQMDPFKKD